MSGRLGELLVRENLISLQQLQKAQDEQRKTGGRIGSLLVRSGAIAEHDLTSFLSKQYGVPAISLKDFDIDEEVLKLIPRSTAEKHQVVPVNRAGASLIVAMSDPSNIFAIDDIKFLTGYNVEVVVASEQAIKEAIDKHYMEKGPNLEEVMAGFDDGDISVVEAEGDDINAVDLEKSAEEAPVVKLVNLILLDAIKKGASDIHIEPYEKDFRVRFRIDGSLYEVMKPPMKLKSAIISRLKIMSELDISERRLPQDGRIKLKLGKGKEMDFRVSVCPTLFGEKVVMRLLDKSNLQLDMTKLGFEEQQLKDFMEAIDRPYGMVLVTGPTGSGKTTTLYSALSKLNEVAWNISTAEDPVEFNFFGINQVQMHEDIGLNFAAALRSFLRQDPDIIMVGEIRDFETAEIGVKAALTGHLVLSTLHTNDAPGTVSRLLNMGIEPFLVTASLNAIVAQRLCRRLCAECKRPAQVDDQALLDAGFAPEEIGTFQPFEPVGCRTCNDRGYKGRVAVYEVMPLWDGLKELVIQGCSTAELKQEAIRLGFRTLRMSALNKVKLGVTTLAEAVGNTAPDKF
ncbi:MULTISPECIES: type IV-A pilus assembly ATPase PilB [Anaeromyxobacter]|uniref:type IV-A pilus assembly ATPase PilB n=1 Tax=Anaeromyxobacter TaxID=161492 RepID=UPI001F5A17B0|nr:MULTISPECIES: type IV-A pilus assembly ATPase PilB [unclassified Anaeromyxobacter]